MKVSIKNLPVANRSALNKIKKGFGYSFQTLLSPPEANPKIKKNSKVGVLTAGMHLSPSDSAGVHYGESWNVCPKASDGCKAMCLHTAGNPAYMEGKIRARLDRTRMFFLNRDLFAAILVNEITSLLRKATKAGMQCGIRLNATSDICWESFYIDHRLLMKMFPTVEFYDYTAIANRTTPSNYHLTFSLKENNMHEAMNELNRGSNVAVVFDTKRGQELPSTYLGYDVINGDEHDFRPLDAKDSIVGLRAKGKAIYDVSGFVQGV
jgi:hypothetical protein